MTKPVSALLSSLPRPSKVNETEGEASIALVCRAPSATGGPGCTGGNGSIPGPGIGRGSGAAGAETLRIDDSSGDEACARSVSGAPPARVETEMCPAAAAEAGPPAPDGAASVGTILLELPPPRPSTLASVRTANRRTRAARTLLIRRTITHRGRDDNGRTACPRSP